MPRVPTCKSEFSICSWNARLLTCAGNTRCCVATCPSYPGAASGKHTKKNALKSVIKKLEKVTREGKANKQNPKPKELPSKGGEEKGHNEDSHMLPLPPSTASTRQFLLSTLIYNPVSCKTYILKSLLNEILVRSRDSTSSWKHTGYTTVVHSVFIISD